MPWRRCLWFGLLLALGWGLFLYMPPRPRATISASDVPLKTNGARLITGRVEDPTKQPVGNAFLQLPVAIDGPLIVWDAVQGSRLREIDVENATVQEISDDLRFAIITDEATLQTNVWDLSNGTHWLADAQVPLERFSPRGTMLLPAARDPGRRLLDAATGKILVAIPAGFEPVCFDPEDAFVLFAGQADGVETAPVECLAWRRDSGDIRKGTVPGDVEDGIVAPREALAALRLRLSEGTSWVLWDVERGAVRCALPLAWADTVAFSPNGRLLAAWSQEQAGLEFFDTQTGKSVGREPRANVRNAAFSAAGTLFSYLDQREEQTFLAVVSVPSGKETLRRPDLEGFDSFSWAADDEHRLLAALPKPMPIGNLGFAGGFGGAPQGGIGGLPRFGNPPGFGGFGGGMGGGFGGGPGGFGGMGGAFGGQGGGVILNGETGQELFASEFGEFSQDMHAVAIIQTGGAAEVYGLPEKLVAWIPGFNDHLYSLVTVKHTDTGAQLLRRVRTLPSENMISAEQCLHVDPRRLILAAPGIPTEIWELPAPRPWLWILGPPAALAGMPWLWRSARRKFRGSFKTWGRHSCLPDLAGKNA